MAEFVGALTTNLNSAGNILVLDPDNVTPGLLPVSEIKAQSDLATTALQPGDLGSAAGADTGDFMLVADHEAQVAILIARIEALEGSTGYDLLACVESGIVEVGVLTQ